MYAGLEIINTLGRYWNMSLPVFIDNAESYTSLPQIDSQVIQLIVNAADTVLRIEVEGGAETTENPREIIPEFVVPEQLTYAGMDF